MFAYVEALTEPRRRRTWWPMVDNITKTSPPAALQWVTAASSIAMLLMLLVVNLLGAGGIFGHDTATVVNLQQRIDGLSSQVARLSDKMDASPRPDQLQDIVRHMSAQDGRMDSVDTRLRDLAERQAALAARLESIDAASRAQLPTRR